MEFCAGASSEFSATCATFDVVCAMESDRNTQDCDGELNKSTEAGERHAVSLVNVNAELSAFVEATQEFAIVASARRATAEEAKEFTTSFSEFLGAFGEMTGTGADWAESVLDVTDCLASN